jgi:ATP-dependent metalloprotease FtsH
MNNSSRALEFVINRAEKEAERLGKEISPDFIFLALLKLPEMTAEEVAPKSRYMRKTADEIHSVAALLKEAGVGADPAERSKLREALADCKESPGGYQAVERLWRRADKKDGSWITAEDVALTLLKEPTHILRTTFRFHFDFLAILTKRMRNLREALLDRVYGQNHVVHAFTEGIFNSELFAAVDRHRKRPRAIFVFAGPPGVGKTFFAEQAAEELSVAYKRFDMSSYADHQAHLNLIGSKHTGQAGLLTGFVKKNSLSILLFDEIEKAHLNTIQLFLQILDAGLLQDDYLDEPVSFYDTIIIFTTNAGKQLYEGDFRLNAAGLPRQTILNALETDRHPQTERPFFPNTICSRLATGYLMMFNHLQIHDLERVCENEFNRFAALFRRQYAIQIEKDEFLIPSLIFAEGRQADARTLRAQTELFLKKEIFRLCRLLEKDAMTSLKELKTIRFEVRHENLSPDVEALFKNTQKPGILFFGDKNQGESLQKIADGITICQTQDSEQALTTIAAENISCVLLELWVENELNNIEGTIGSFTYTPITARGLAPCRKFLEELRHRMPELPVYLIEKDEPAIDSELYASFIQAGVREKLVWPADTKEQVIAFNRQIKNVCFRVYLQNRAAHLALQHKVLRFETTPIPSKDKKEVTIRLRELRIRRALFAGDIREILDDTEKPTVRFEQVFGAEEAKKELRRIVSVLTKPQYSALNSQIPRGILLYGPPGTGKTMLAKAMAGESDIAFISVTGSSFVTKYQGSGPEAIRRLFEKARRYAPAIIFIDEIDAVGRARGSSYAAHGEEMALNALLSEMDGFATDPKRPVFVLAATNVDVAKDSANILDPALIRRFDRKILVDLPNREERCSYLKAKLKKTVVSNQVIERLADRSLGFSIAGLSAILERIIPKEPRNDEQLEDMFETICHGEKKDVESNYVERVAWHEAGHAYMCCRAGNIPSYITIVARGNHGGYTEEYAGKHKPDMLTKDELLRRVRIFLGGRAAELVHYGDRNGLSTGCSDDLQNAVKLIRAMICSYGMDDITGMIILTEKEATEGPLAEKIMERVSQIIREELDKTKEELSKGEDQVKKLAKALLEKHKLVKEEIEKLLEGAS